LPTFDGSPSVSVSDNFLVDFSETTAFGLPDTVTLNN